MFGESYVGATQMLAAMAHPPHLAGICPGFTPSNYHEGWVYQGGAFEEWFNQSWTSILAQDGIRRLAQAGSRSLLEREELPLQNYRLFSLPRLSQPTELIAALTPYYSDWLAHPDYDGYWKAISIEEHFKEIHVPALTTAAWYDIFLGGSLRNYSGLRAQAGGKPTREGQRLLITIGGHAGSGRKIGDFDFGPDAALYPDDDVTLAWYGFLFKNAKSQLTSGKPVKYFLMGVNQWREAESWPPPEAHITKLYLHSEGKANSSSGNGSLSEKAPVSESFDHYKYDPGHPMPTKGSPLCCDGEIPSGPQDQRQLEVRDDVLVYSTPPLRHDLAVVGPVTVQLYATSSAVDTDFTAKLVDLAPDGYARNLTEGILRGRYRESSEHSSLLTPGVIYKFTIDLWATANVFKAGHKMRLEISSSNWPRFDANLNTGEPFRSGTRLVVAATRVFHDSSHPSSLNVSFIVPDSSSP
jgi:putative CocE/NonD family hydrolase